MKTICQCGEEIEVSSSAVSAISRLCKGCRKEVYKHSPYRTRYFGKRKETKRKPKLEIVPIYATPEKYRDSVNKWFKQSQAHLHAS